MLYVYKLICPKSTSDWRWKEYTNQAHWKSPHVLGKAHMLLFGNNDNSSVYFITCLMKPLRFALPEWLRLNSLGTATHIGQCDRTPHTDKKPYRTKPIWIKRLEEEKKTLTQQTRQAHTKLVIQKKIQLLTHVMWLKVFCLLWREIHASCLHFHSLRNSGCWCSFHTHAHFLTVLCVCMYECVRLWTSSLVLQLCRRFSEDRRPLGQLQNNEALKATPDSRV